MGAFDTLQALSAGYPLPTITVLTSQSFIPNQRAKVPEQAWVHDYIPPPPVLFVQVGVCCELGGWIHIEVACDIACTYNWFYLHAGILLGNWTVGYNTFTTARSQVGTFPHESDTKWTWVPRRSPCPRTSPSCRPQKSSAEQSTSRLVPYLLDAGHFVLNLSTPTFYKSTGLTSSTSRSHKRDVVRAWP